MSDADGADVVVSVALRTMRVAAVVRRVADCAVLTGVVRTPLRDIGVAARDEFMGVAVVRAADTALRVVLRGFAETAFSVARDWTVPTVRVDTLPDAPASPRALSRITTPERVVVLRSRVADGDFDEDAAMVDRDSSEPVVFCLVGADFCLD